MPCMAVSRRPLDFEQWGSQHHLWLCTLQFCDQLNVKQLNSDLNHILSTISTILSLFSVENQALILPIYRRDNGCLPMRYKEILSDCLYFRMKLNHTPAHCNIHIYQPVEALITPGILVSDFIGPHVHILHAQDGLFICYRVLFLLFRVHIFRCSRTITRTVS